MGIEEQGICNRCKKLSDDLSPDEGLCHDCERFIHCQEEALLDRNRMVAMKNEAREHGCRGGRCSV